MPAKWFRCPDQKTVLIEDCLKLGGCRMNNRCATLSYLRLIGYDREWRGVTPSAAGTGPRLLYLRASTDYTIDPNDRTFAALGTSVHGKLSLHQYTHDVLAEEELSDEKMRGIADVLEVDEENQDFYILTDYKTWGSFKVGKAFGLVKIEKPLLDENGDPVLLKSGKNKGKPKMKAMIEMHPEKADIYETALQLNRYRIFFERANFKISKIQVQAIVRDGNSYTAKNRGIERNLYLSLIHI